MTDLADLIRQKNERDREERECIRSVMAVWRRNFAALRSVIQTINQELEAAGQRNRFDIDGATIVHRGGSRESYTTVGLHPYGLVTIGFRRSKLELGVDECTESKWRDILTEIYKADEWL